MVDYYQAATGQLNMDKIKEKKKYEALIQDASKLFLDKEYSKALKLYSNAFTFAKELRLGQMMICVIKYMIAQCLFHSNKLDDLAEAIMLLQTVDKALKARLPACYCLLAQAHCKLFRYDQALEIIKEGDQVYKKEPLLESFYIPGTTVAIKQGLTEETWKKVKEECFTWHQPDAVCALAECNNITKPYVTPSKNIFKSDPAFNGMVSVYCNNKKNPCSLKFHQSCWKFKKDRMYPIEKISDKEILGNVCFTPNCMNDEIQCLISAIEIIGPDGEVKALIKESISVVWPISKNVSKGAIKKVKLPPTKKSESIEVFWKQNNSVTPKQEINSIKQLNRFDGFGEKQILAVKYNSPDVDFSLEPPNIANEKNFLLSYYYEYIQNNLVRVCDAYSMFDQINESLQLKDLDILAFLLETNKFDVLDNSYNTIYAPSQVQETVTNNIDRQARGINTNSVQNTNGQKFKEDNDSHYAELMCDDDDEYSEMTEVLSQKDKRINKVAMPNENSLDDIKSNYATSTFTNFNNEAGGDAPSYLKFNLHGEKTNRPLTPPGADPRAGPFSNLSEKRGTDNRKLKEYISQMENELKDMEEDSCCLKKELKDKDLEIQSLKENQETYAKKIETFDKLYLTMLNFQKKYENLQEENLKIKEELISSIIEKKKLEEKLLELNNPELRRQELVKSFQEEYKILQDHINSDWEKKIEKLEQSLQKQIETKMKLLDKSLNYQFTGHRHLLNGCIDQSTAALEIIYTINVWMEKTINIRDFIDSNEWRNRLSFLQKTVADHQIEYSKLLNELQSHSTEEKLNMTNISISLPTIPKPPLLRLNDLIQSAFDRFYKGQCQILQGVMKTQAIPAYPTTAPNYLHYSQLYHQQNPTAAFSSATTATQLQYQLRGYPPMADYIGLQQQSAQHQQFVQQYAQQQQQQFSPQRSSVLSTETKPNQDHKFYSSNTENASVKSEPIMDSKSDIKEEQKDDREEKEVRNKHNNEDKKNVDNQTSTSNINEKIEKMRKALKLIELNVKEKCEPESTSNDKKETKSENAYDNEQTQTADIQETLDEFNGNNVHENALSRNLEVASECGSDASIKIEKKAIKKIGADGLTKRMLKKYPGALETDIIEIIDKIRKKHNNSLSGISLGQIIKESDDYFLNCQRLHLLQYHLNDGSKTTFNNTTTKSSDSRQQHVHKETIPSTSSCTSLNKSDVPTTPKKTWNMVPQEEAKWDPKGEIECSICMAPVNRNKCHTLKCRHSFHSQCVKMWLKSDRSCPNCRIAVTDDDEFPPLP